MPVSKTLLRLFQTVPLQNEKELSEQLRPIQYSGDLPEKKQIPFYCYGIDEADCKEYEILKCHSVNVRILFKVLKVKK